LFYRPDILNTLHSGIVLAQLIQAAGRGRGVNRSESEPLDVFIFGSDSIPPLEFDEMRRWDEIEPDILADMVYEGLVMTSPADTLKMLRQLFENGATVDAARMAMRRAGITPDLANIPPIYISYGECSPNAQGWRRVKYRPVGRGQQTRIAFAHPSRLATLKADLESALGPLAVFDGYRSR
jgi:hypothetical protein